MNFDNKDSFFYKIIQVLHQYNIPDIVTLKQNIPSKNEWKTAINRTATKYWTESLVRDSYSKSTLRFLAVGRISGGCVHPVWRTTENSVVDVRKAVIKTRMLTGTYILQKNVHTISFMKTRRASSVSKKKNTFVICYCTALC